MQSLLLERAAHPSAGLGLQSCHRQTLENQEITATFQCETIPIFTQARQISLEPNSKTAATRSDSSGCMLLLLGRESYKLQDDNKSSISFGMSNMINPES